MRQSYLIILFTALGLLAQKLVPAFVTANQSLLTKNDLYETYRRLETFGRR
ncbi:MAG TPA: hypothetical protein VI524_15810 [Anaerolineales bacterium]|nr:hypothetical protein [Anaerolineales bacterium]